MQSWVAMQSVLRNILQYARTLDEIHDMVRDHLEAYKSKNNSKLREPTPYSDTLSKSDGDDHDNDDYDEDHDSGYQH